jgi:uncharacterized membrane-anchored protein YjiN (DUF445 family)
MRRFATGLLVAMAAVFALSHHFAGGDPASAWQWPLAFAEAAMVGGLADWFAVTALFRHPLGLPIPHTAIIPENKDRIADSMAGFLKNNFLTAPVVARRLRGVNVAGAVGGFLADPSRGAALRLRPGAAGLLGDLLHSLAGEQLGTMVKSGVRGQLERLEVAPLLGQMLGAMIADRRHLPLLEAMLRWAGLTLEENEPLIRGIIHERANAIVRWTGLDERLANGILDGLYRLLAECIVDPDHPLRHKAEEGLETLAHDLVHDPAMRARVERMKGELLDNPAMAAWLDGLWTRARAALVAAAGDPESLRDGRLGAGLAAVGEALARDARLQLAVNRFVRRALAGMATRYGASIVKLVSETVRRWDARTVTARIEGAVGRDLQFIRINGTLVGGCIGLLLHTVQRFA